MQDSTEGKFASFYDLFFEKILERVRKQHVLICQEHAPKNIIDLGCGTGSQNQLLSKEGFQTTGIDISDQMLHVAKKKNISKAIFLKEDILNNNFKKGSFECATLTLVLHANDHQTLLAILKEATRLTDDGLIIITDYDKAQGVKGLITSIVIHVIESFAQHSHRSSYYAFKKRGGLQKILIEEGYTATEKAHYYGGSLKTFIIKKT